MTPTSNNDRLEQAVAEAVSKRNALAAAVAEGRIVVDAAILRAKEAGASNTSLGRRLGISETGVRAAVARARRNRAATTQSGGGDAA